MHVNAVECAKPLNASVLLMHLNVYQHERIIYVNDFEGSVDDTANEVIITTTKMHKNTKNECCLHHDDVS